MAFSFQRKFCPAKLTIPFYALRRNANVSCNIVTVHNPGCTAVLTVTMKFGMRIHLITTGGTLEKMYREQTGNVENVDSKVDRYLERLRLPDLDIRINALMNKDSLEMTDHDRLSVVAAVRSKLASEPAPVVITHGTDTVVATGTLLKRQIRHLAVPVIFTGAMTPLGFEASDGLQNLTESLMAARLLPPGVYLVMHNQVFEIDHVRKDRERSRFIAI